MKKLILLSLICIFGISAEEKKTDLRFFIKYFEMIDEAERLKNESKSEKSKDAFDAADKFIQSKLKPGMLILSDSECLFSRGTFGGEESINVNCSFLKEKGIIAKYVIEGQYAENKKNYSDRKHALFIQDLKNDESFEGVLRLYNNLTMGSRRTYLANQGYGFSGGPFEIYVIIEKAQKAKTTKAESEEKDKSILTRLKAGDYVSRDQIISELEKYEKNCKGE